MKPADAVRHVSPARPSFRPDQPVSDLGFAELPRCNRMMERRLLILRRDGARGVVPRSGHRRSGWRSPYFLGLWRMSETRSVHGSLRIH